MKVLYGTSNSAKLASMIRICSNLNMQILSLLDIDCSKIPHIEETGNSPLENARIKALAYYKTFGIPVFSCDSGLFIKGLDENIQPGVFVRRVNGKELNDEEMITYYANLAAQHGGTISAYYKNAICFVVDENNIYEYDGKDIHNGEFYITSTPHSKRIEGFPLDTLSVHIETGNYYFDLDDTIQTKDLSKGIQKFFINSGIKE